jgi:Tol biopolymer transport system component
VLRTNDFHTVGELVETDSKVVFAPSAFEEGKGYLFYARGGTLLAQSFDTRRLQVVGQPLPVATHIYSFSKTAAADFSIAGSTLAYQNYVSRSQLIWIDRAGRELATLGPANINAKSARISPDGRRVATAIYDGSQGQQDLWIFDLPTNSGRRLSAESSLRDAPVWSPDSSSIAFLADSDGRPPRVHVRGLGTTDEDRVMPASGFQLPTDWSPDGRFIAFVNTGFPRTANETQGDVWLLDTTNSWKAIPLLISKFHEANPAFSPNGRWLAFTSDESGQPELYVQAFTAGDAPRMTGERHLVSRSGAQAVRWRRDGKELFYLALDGKVHAVSVTLSAEPRFSAPTPLFTISTEARAAIHSVMGFDVSADGQRFIIVRALEAPSLVVVRNWETLLKQRGKPL